MSAFEDLHQDRVTGSLAMFDRMIFKGRLTGLYKPRTVPAPLAQRTPRTSPPHRAHTHRELQRLHDPTGAELLDQLNALLPETPRSPRFPNAQTSPGSEPDSTSCNNAESTRPPCHCDGPAERWSMIGQAGTPGSGALPSHNRSAVRVSNWIMSIQISSRGNVTLPAADSASLSACPPVRRHLGRCARPSPRVAAVSLVVTPAHPTRHREPDNSNGRGETSAVVARKERRVGRIVAIAPDERPADQREDPGGRQTGPHRWPSPPRSEPASQQRYRDRHGHDHEVLDQGGADHPAG
jgi:hypothetical protein